MKKLYKPENEVELSLLKSIFESEDVSYFVHNDHFGSLKIGPQIDLFNAKTIMVPENQFEKAKEIVSNYLNNVHDNSENTNSRYSLSDKIRMIVEALLFTWFVPGKKRTKKNKL